MARISFQKALERFTHIDGEFVRFETRMPPNEATLTVSMYPWWEHPAVIQAHKEKKRWRWTGEPKWREVTVFATGVIECAISPGYNVIDWDFVTAGPLLWRFEAKGHLFSNVSVSVATVLEIIEEAASQLKVRKATIHRLFAPDLFHMLGTPGPISLGSFPCSVFYVLKEALLRRGVELFGVRDPEPKELDLVVFTCDLGTIVARNFELEVPRFQQLADWCVVE